MGRPDKRKAARGSQFVGKKKECHGINLSRGNGCFPKNSVTWIQQGLILQSSELDPRYDKGLYYNDYGGHFDEESQESDSGLDSEENSDSKIHIWSSMKRSEK